MLIFYYFNLTRASLVVALWCIWTGFRRCFCTILQIMSRARRASNWHWPLYSLGHKLLHVFAFLFVEKSRNARLTLALCGRQEECLNAQVFSQAPAKAPDNFIFLGF